LEELNVIIKKQSARISALIVEPIVQAAAGMLVWPKGALSYMARLAQQNDILFIADEVATGFGRTGKMFACEHEGITPDIMCISKGLSAGYLALAATLVKEKVYRAFLADYKEKKTFFHGHSYTGNPLACAAALANLEVFQKEKVLEKLEGKIAFLKKALEKFKKLAHVGDIRQKGFMVGIELVKDKITKAPYPWQEKIGIRVCQQARKYGVILRPLGNVIVLMPPLAIDVKQLAKLLEVVYLAIEKVTFEKT